MDQQKRTSMRPEVNASNSKCNNKRARRRHLIGAIDQGTSSTRFLVFENRSGRLIASSQIEIKRIAPKEGWIEIDPDAIMSSVYSTISQTSQQLSQNSSSKLKCIGICNQRESAVVWDIKTGKALYNVIVWMDNRTKDIVDDMIDSVPGRDFNFLKDKTGLPMSTYFSAFKLKWLIDNVPEVRRALKEDTLRFGTVDSWILWNLTGRHLTDVTNASRTFLMDIETLDWDQELCKLFNIPIRILPKIRASADDFGLIQHGPLKGLPITGVIGDQSAALFGHNCLRIGQTKATFGTGCFIMQNIGPGPLKGALKGIQREAKRGLITTVGFKLRDSPACYALEGSIKIAGAALTWLRDNLQLIKDYEECDELISKTTHSAGVFFVPALGGLYSPYWDPNAAGLYIGLSQFTRREHLVRATFDSIAFQTNDILSLMKGVTSGLMIDGGLCKSNNMCQILADITGCDIVRPSMCETSALGAAMVAGCGAGIWSYESMLTASPHSNIAPGRLSPELVQEHQSHTELDEEEPTPADKFSSLIQSRTIGHLQKEQQNENQVRQVMYLDAGGGVNDDAGGGIHIDDDNKDDWEDDDGDLDNSLSSFVDSDEEEEEAGDREVTTSGEFTANTEEACNAEVEMVISREPIVVDGVATDQLDVVDHQQRLRSYATPSSGYDSSSGDNCDVNTFDELIDTRNSTKSKSPPKLATITRLNSPITCAITAITPERRKELVETWRAAVERSMKWTKVHHEEVRRVEYQRLSSVPISMYLFLSIGIVALSGYIGSAR